MFQPAALFIGLRYARARKGNGFVSFINFFSTAGITIGVFALIIVVSVMNGFERELKSRILGLAPQVVLSQSSPLSPSQQDAALQLLQRQPDVKGAVPFVESQALIQSSQEMRGVQLIGVVPEQEQGLSALAGAMVQGQLGALQPGDYKLVLSTALAQRLGVYLGDKVRLSLLEGARFTPMGQVPSQRKFQVAGLFELGSEADLAYAYVAMADAARLIRLPKDHAEGIRLYLSDAFQASALVNALSASGSWQGWQFDSWQRTHGELFAAVKMEKGMMWLLLMLIVAVAAFNIVSALFLMVSSKQSEVAILQTLGLSPRQIRHIFMIQGCSQGVLGALLGTLFGILATMHLDSLIQLLGLQVVPTPGYSKQSLPVVMNTLQIACIFALAVALSFLATLYPARQAANVLPAEALRYE